MLLLERQYSENQLGRMPTTNSSSKQSHQRHPSRPGSASSSSVVTIQRAASLSSRSGSRTPHTKIRSQSPSESSYSAPLAQGTLSPDQARGTSAGHSRPNSIVGIKEGVGNLNRWSQSTTSSKNSGNGHHRRGSFSRRLSLGSGSLGSLKSITHPQSPPTRNVLTKSRSSPSRPSPTEPLPPPLPMSEVSSVGVLPPIITLPALSQAVESASPSTAANITPATTELLTPSTFNGADYFTEKWKGKSPLVNRPMEQRLGPASIEASTNVHVRNASIDPTKPVSTPESVYSPERSSTKRGRSRDTNFQGGHTRSTDDNGKGSGGTGGGSSASSVRSERRHKTPSQKAMLSKALQKANTAVLLDNAQNFEGAMEAYANACHLLQQVMDRSAGDEDRRKLEAIRNTYTNRIAELRNLDFTFQTADGKPLPERPMSNDSITQDIGSPIDDEEEEAVIIETATATRIVNTPSYVPERRETRTLAPSQIPPRRQSLLPSAFDEEIRFSNASPAAYHSHQRSFSKSPRQEVERSVTLAAPFDAAYIPPPLSPRRPLSPGKDEPGQPPQIAPPPIPMQISGVAQHTRDMSTETTSWLDTIDESGGSSSSSVHSRTSSLKIHRKQIKMSNEQTEAEFDAALDAAVEAAYNDGFEVADDYYDEEDYIEDDPVTNVRRNVELAKQRVREVEIEAELALATEKEKKRLHQEQRGRPRGESVDIEYGDDEAEEEERLLEEMTKGYVMDDFEFDLQSSKSALPRTSDSSGFSGRTWGSSIGSNTTTAGTSLSTVAETSHFTSMVAQMQPKLPPPHPPPVAALPAPPTHTHTHASSQSSHMSVQPPHPPPSMPAPRPPSLGSSPGPGVRERRLSGQNVKQLKIETHAKLPPTLPKKEPPSGPPPSIPVPALQDEPKPLPAVTAIRTFSTPPQPRFSAALPPVPPSPQRHAEPGPASEELKRTESPTAKPVLVRAMTDVNDVIPPVPPSPIHMVRTTSGPGMESLRKAQKSRNLSVSAQEIQDVSPNTPMSATFPTTVEPRKGVTATMPVLPTPTGTTFTVNGLPTGGLYLFDNNIHSPNTPGSPNALSANAPVPLEPCPDSFLLRPFWLMRCLYQTIAHPRGGYISTKLFVPHDVWRVKNVKIKGVDEKVSSCDLLTAALLNLAKVDTYDADAVLDEMQSFETIMEQVQASLSKKLGSEVGVQSSATLFKGSPATEEAASHGHEILSSKSTNQPGKSYLASWRKLRSKNSGAGLTTTFTTSTKDSGRETLSMSSLPMTTVPSARPAKRNVAQVQATGPNANYMSALARLFDAAQVLDQIARQVEDPGLKHSSPTHVGLELSARHAAEFFGFYICRFALNDVGMMLDKFIKRGSEWVLV